MARLKVKGSLDITLLSDEWEFDTLDGLREKRAELLVQEKKRFQEALDLLRQAGFTVDNAGIVGTDIEFRDQEEEQRYIKTSRETVERESEELDRVYAIAQELRIENAIWSMEPKLLIDNEQAYIGEYMVEYQGWHVPLTDPTWRDLFKAADQLITVTQDLHHVFVENLEQVDRSTIRLSTGS